MENLLQKIIDIPDNLSKRDKKVFDNWTLEEEKQLLEIYYILSKKENHIFNLIYKYHGCDSYEDIFRDYNMQFILDKAAGVKIAIDGIVDEITKNNEKENHS